MSIIFKGWLDEQMKFRCDPLTIAGIVMAAAGAGSQIVASGQESGRMNNAVQSELNQQEQFQKQGQKVVQTNIDANTPKAFGDQVSQGAQQAQGQYNSANAIPLTTPMGGGVNSNPTENQVVSDQGGAQVKLGNEASAPLQGYNDAQVQQWIKNLQTNTALGQIQRNSQDVAALLPLQLRAAQNSSSGLAGFGSLLNTAGGLVGLYGATQPVTGEAATASQSAQALKEYGGAYVPPVTLPASNLNYGNIYG